MAGIYPGMKCPICESVIDPGDLVVTTRPFLDEGDPLFIYSEMAMHKRCFLKWPRRNEFVARYRQATDAPIIEGAAFKKRWSPMT
jgi:hypothetical protein